MHIFVIFLFLFVFDASENVSKGLLFILVQTGKTINILNSLLLG